MLRMESLRVVAALEEAGREQLYDVPRNLLAASQTSKRPMRPLSGNMHLDGMSLR
jgi:hypothetical protein